MPRQPNSPNLSNIKQFLAELHPEANDANRLPIWVKQRGQSVSKTHWFSDTDAAAEFCARTTQAVGADVYFSLSLHNFDAAMDAMEATKGHRSSMHTRGVYASTAAINCVWLDLDVGTDGHKKPTPATVDDALKLLDAAYGDMRPTVTVASGGGLHCYWLFHEPIFFDSEIDRQAAQDLSSKWQSCIHVAAASNGYVIDRTADLTRVLRVPETFNWKTGEPRDVKIIENRLITDWARRYDAHDLLDWFETINPRGEYIQGTADRKDKTPVDLDGATFPREKWALLCEADPRVQMVFRHEVPLDDNSDSAYDMSLSISAARAGWTDGEIYALMRTHRNRGDAPPDNQKHEGYYKTTIRKARACVSREADNESRNEVLSEIQLSIDSGELAIIDKDDPDMVVEREKVVKRHLSLLRAAIGIDVKSIKKYMAQPPYFVLETDKGGVNLGDVDGLISQRRFRSSVAATNGVLMSKQEAGEWQTVAQLLLHACEEVDLGGEGDERTETIEWIQAHVANGVLSDVASAIKQRSPMRQDEGVYFYLSSLAQAVELEFHRKVSRGELSRRVKSIGCENTLRRMNLDDGGMSKPQRVWLAPSRLIREIDDNGIRSEGGAVVDIRRLKM